MGILDHRSWWGLYSECQWTVLSLRVCSWSWRAQARVRPWAWSQHCKEKLAKMAVFMLHIFYRELEKVRKYIFLPLPFENTKHPFSLCGMCFLVTEPTWLVARAGAWWCCSAQACKWDVDAPPPWPGTELGWDAHKAGTSAPWGACLVCRLSLAPSVLLFVSRPNPWCLRAAPMVPMGQCRAGDWIDCWVVILAFDGTTELNPYFSKPKNNV